MFANVLISMRDATFNLFASEDIESILDQNSDNKNNDINRIKNSRH